MIEQPAAPGHLLDVLGEVGADRVDLDMAWVHHDRPDTTWLGMLRSQLTLLELADTAPERRMKLIRLTALSVAWIQALDRRGVFDLPVQGPREVATGVCA